MDFVEPKPICGRSNRFPSGDSEKSRASCGLGLSLEQHVSRLDSGASDRPDLIQAFGYRTFPIWRWQAKMEVKRTPRLMFPSAAPTHSNNRLHDRVDYPIH